MKIIIKIILCLLIPFSAYSKSDTEFPTLKEQIQYYQNRYKVECVEDKITDNYGNGFDSLYGTRNMRTILYGIAYRGGANNFYHKLNKRENQNPLLSDGLENLCKEGFTDVVYLYSKNYLSAPREMIVGNNKLEYLQISGNNAQEINRIIEMVYEVIIRKRKGPIYFHCWNGWHQSGYVAAVILKQFCGYSDEKALNYWVRNTDGASRGYEQIKKRIIEFKPLAEFEISKELQQDICPCLRVQ